MQFYSPGKLMITGEYAVLQGAKAFALPTKFGQYLLATPAEKDIKWVAIDENGVIWFEANFDPNDPESMRTTNAEMANRLFKLLRFCLDQNPSLNRGWTFESGLNFNRNWGLGSSSTLVANLAKWSSCNPYDLLHSAFSGSGYDVAVGMEGKALTFLHDSNSSPKIEKMNWYPSFADQLFFVYLGSKQDSADEIRETSSLVLDKELVAEITSITQKITKPITIEEFSALLTQHEKIISQYLGRKTIKEERFADYPNLVKSLGAWGGDFVMAVGDKSHHSYFLSRGYSQIFAFDEMIDSISLSKDLNPLT